LPDHFRDCSKLRVFAPPHTQRIAQQIQAWRRPTNPIDTHSLTHRSSPAPDTTLIITIPPPEDAPRIAARLLSTTIPFAVLLPSELVPRIADAGHFQDQPDLALPYAHGGKVMFLDSDQLWFIGNIVPLHNFAKLYSQVLQQPLPLSAHFAASRNATLPTTIVAWKDAQAADPAVLDDIPPESLLLCDGLSLHKDADFSSHIIVPPTLREALTRQHHADLQHVSHPKVLTSLATTFGQP
jgi:hypothetical protein